MTTPNLYAVATASPDGLTITPTLLGHTLTLIPSELAAPLLCPLPDGDAVLLGDWTDDFSQPFRVPAALVDAVRSALGLSGVTA